MKKLVIIALILAVATGFFAYTYLNGLEGQDASPTKDVVVAVNQIPEHTVITADMVEVVTLDENAVNSLSVSEVSSVLGKVTKMTIEPGEQILTTKLSDLGSENSELSYTIEEGYRALTIKTDEISGVAGEIVKGDRVDIIAILNSTQDGSTVLSSQIILENIEVLAVGTGAESEDTIYTSVTVSVPAEDVLQLHYALAQGVYRLTLRSVVDKDIVNAPPYAVTISTGTSTN